jgi:hypothetical protein
MDTISAFPHWSKEFININIIAPVGRAGPNPSVKRSANGRPPGPGRWYALHFHRPGPGGLPSAPAYLQR